MPNHRSNLCLKNVIQPLSSSGILLTMVLALSIATLTGCIGTASPTKSSPAPNAAALQIATTSLAAGSVGNSYLATLAATGGTPPYSWITGGTLPSGLQLSAPTGTISGTPTTVGSFPITFQVQDTKKGSASASLSLNVSAAPAPTISGVSPSRGSTAGGTAVTISGNNFRSGAVVQFGFIPAPAVQVVNSSQIQTVTPAEGNGAINVTVQDSDGQTATAANGFAFTAPSLQIATTSLPAGSVGAGYSTTLAATGGTPPYKWSATSGALPVGVNLSASGTLAGTPAVAGSFSFTAQVQDSKSVISSARVSMNVSPDPAPTISGVSPSSGPTDGGIAVTISGGNFRSGAGVNFGSIPAASVQVINSGQIRAVAPAEANGVVSVSVQDSDGQKTTEANAFTFTVPTAPSADVVVDASQTVSETGGDDLAAAKNIYASASAPESDGGLYPDWNLIASEFVMRRMRNINGLGDCALDGNGKLTGCSRLNNDLQIMKVKNLTPHVIVGQWAPASIDGNPRQWSPSKWAQYDSLCYAIVNYVSNQYGGTGFTEALFEVGNEMDTTTDPRNLWLTTTPTVGPGDSSRFTQFDTVYKHWANAVDQVAKQTPNKRIRIAAPSTGFWTVYYGSGQLWHNQIVEEYAKQRIRLDVVSLHIYSGEADDLAKYAQGIRSTLVASGNPNAEIWVSEWGASDASDSYFGGINGSNQGAAWAVYFLLQALKGTITGGSFLEVRDNQGHDTTGENFNMNVSSWFHVENGLEYPKAIANAFNIVSLMAGTRKAVTTNSAKPDLQALAASNTSSASVIISNYHYIFDYKNKNYSDLTKSESVTVAFKNLPFSGPVTVERYLIDSQTSNLNYWVAAGKIPPSIESTQLQKVESFSANSSSGALSLQSRALGPSAVSLWIVHQ